VLRCRQAQGVKKATGRAPKATTTPPSINCRRALSSRSEDRGPSGGQPRRICAFCVVTVDAQTEVEESWLVVRGCVARSRHCPRKRSEMPLVKWVSSREKGDEVIINGGRSTDGGRRDVPPTTKRTWLAWDAGANGGLRGLSLHQLFTSLQSYTQQKSLRSCNPSHFASVPFGPPPQGPTSTAGPSFTGRVPPGGVHSAEHSAQHPTDGTLRFSSFFLCFCQFTAPCR